MTEKKRTSASYSSLQGFHRAVPIILFAVAVFTMFCFITQDMGVLGNAISTVFMGLFSYGAYALPLLLALHAVFYASDLKENRIVSRVVFSIITLTAISSLAYAITYWSGDLVFNAKDFWNNGRDAVGGGFIGSVVGFCLIKAFSRIGLVIIAAATFAIYISYFFSRGQEGISKALFNILKCIVIVLAFIERGIKKLFGKVKNARSEKEKRSQEQKSQELTDDEFFGVDNGMQKLRIPELGFTETRTKESLEENVTLQERVFHRSEVTPEEAEEMELRERAEELFRRDAEAAYEATVTDTAPKRRIVNVDYGDIDTYTPVVREVVEEPVEEAPEEPATAKYDDSADAIFTKDFDPFSMAMSEEMASKPSSKSLLDEMRPTHTVTESISEMSEAEIERARQIQDFERRKAEIISQRRATPVENGGEFTGEKKSIDFREDAPVSFSGISESDEGVSVRLEKRAEPAKAEPAHYTSIGYGEESGAMRTVIEKPAFTVPETIYSHEEPEEEPTASIYMPPKQPVYEAPPTPTFETPVPEYREEPSTPIFTRPMPETAPAAPVFETPKSEPTIPVFVAPAPEHTPEPAAPVFVAPAPEHTPEPAAPVFEAPATERYAASSDHTYTVTENFDCEDNGDEEFVPEFKPYEPIPEEISAEPQESAFAFEDAPTEATLEAERTIIHDDIDEDDEDETEEYQPTAEEDAAMAEDDAGWSSEEIPPEERNPAVEAYRNMFPALQEEAESDETSVGESGENDYRLISPDEEGYEDGFTTSKDDVDTNDPDDEDFDEDDFDDEEPPFEVDEPAPKERKPVKEPEPEKKKPDFSHYVMPPVDLLGFDMKVEDDTSEINENTKILIDTLASFNVTASIKGVDRGPRITRYEVVPARGVKVNAITNLYNDIALNLAKEGIRMEAPIPGKSAIGFEIPNKHPKNVRLRELIECEEFTSASSKTFVCIGKDVAGNPVFGDIAKYPHALICGATGMGKSVCINSIMVSMLYKARPDEVKFIMIDPKKVEFKIYSGIPHLLIPVITEAKQAAGALMWAVEEMERRYELIEKNNIRNLEAYNEKVTFNPALGEPLPKIIIVIDELADLMMQVRDPVEDLVMRIAQKARAAGIHLIIGTQRPSVQVITGAIKANIPSRISCKVTSQVDSRTIFDMGGAEKLLNRGDMLYWPVDRTAALRVQGAFVADSEVEAITTFLKNQVGDAIYDDEVFAEINKAAQKCGNKKSGGGVSADDIDDDGQECGYYNDQQFLDAVELAIRSKKISTSLLQRKLSIGYGKAAKYIDAMEEIGVVSEPKGQKPRDVLINMDEWHERLARIDFG